MKKAIFFFLFFSVIIFAENSTKTNIFIKNNGQWSAEVLYLAQAGGMNAWITETGVVYDNYTIIGSELRKNITKFTPANEVRNIENNIIRKGIVVSVVYENANRNCYILPEQKQDFHYNYFVGPDKRKWTSGVPIYNSVLVKNIYNGIDIRYSFDAGSLRYNCEVAPGADISRIKLKFEGAEDISVNNNGEVVVKTAFGQITHGKIYAFQGKNKIECSFEKTDKHTFGISVHNYDKTKKLIIDPLVYCSYLAGSFGETLNAIKVDNNNNTIVCGETLSADFPTTPGAYSETIAGAHDVIVTKFNQDASALIFSTFIGGISESEEAKDLAIDNSGNIYITGITWSPNYPANTLYTVFGGTHYDAFMTEFNSSGNLIYSTFLGGSGGDEGFAIALSDSNDIFISGFTGSVNFPISSDTFSDTLFNSSVDIFITQLKEFNNAELIVQYSTFLGGGGLDEARDMVVDKNNNVYLAGMTKSTNFPTSDNAVFPTYAGGLQEGFIVKFGMVENDILYSTFLGGSQEDYIDGLAVDKLDNIYVTGTTYSDDFPTTPGAFSESYNGGYYDCFVTKININQSVPVYSTLLGTSTDEQTFDISVDNNFNAFVLGYTLSNLFPLTSGALYDYIGGWDIFITGFNPDGNSLVFSTYFGGTNTDMPTNFVFDSENNIYFTGQTFSSDLPVSVGAFQDTSVLMADGFIAKIEPILTSVENEISATPQKFSLHQNYPNPFNPATTIEYSIPVQTRYALSVQLKIYDILGREIAKLVNEKQQPGNYSVQFNADNLPSGLYIYHLTAGKFISAKKMILLK